MPFYFKKAEKPGRAIRRVCREHIRRALSRLRHSRHPATIHAVRKDIKKLRAILRLVQAENPDAQRKLEKALRRAAGQLAASRDARVIFKAFETLAGRSAARRFPRLHKTLRKNCDQEARRFRVDDSAELSEKILQKAGRRLTHLKIAKDGWAAVEPGLLESFRQGAQGCQLARRPPSPEHFHDWRKHVKVLWSQLKLLCPAWPAYGRTIITRLGRLGELLGNDHDLVLLQQFATEHGPAAEAATLNRLILLRHKKLRAAALKLGAQIYQAEPSAVCQRLGRNWTRWHGK
ncbi:MAG: CHAD domain-containing protein [Verrucomicrobiae bacterium]|nr:CHAD domain-containing protein [Verrucomicrobiae bacterium]